MIRRAGFRTLLLVVASALVLSTSLGFAPAQAGQGNGGEVPGRYIVILNPGADAGEVASKHGLSIENTYSSAVRGFSATGPSGRLNALKDDPRVSIAEHDRRVSLFGKPGPSTTASPAQSLPTGINRIDGDLSSTANINGVDNRVNVDIAIIDTGIQTDHPDLNVVGGKNCATGKSYKDGNGHGSHVAGTAAAKDNGIGVVGVAPGARLWSVRVLDNAGSGWLSWIICGVDWVTANAGTIEVANMSLGGEFTSAALNSALSNSVGAGVTYAVAAGNSSADASGFSPANHPDVITVSALADFNGAGGGGAAATCRSDVDDTFANFSNYGSTVDIAAPGVCIYSTWKGSGYNTISGTSMASPHVVGVAALIKAANPGLSPSGVRAALLAAAKPQSDAAFGFSGDPDSSPEPVAYAGGL